LIADLKGHPGKYGTFLHYFSDLLQKLGDKMTLFQNSWNENNSYQSRVITKLLSNLQQVHIFIKSLI